METDNHCNTSYMDDVTKEEHSEHAKDSNYDSSVNEGCIKSNAHENKTDATHSKGEDIVSVVPDGGWGWMVCLASFMCMLILDGMLFSFGVLFIDLLEYFEAGNSKTALIGSLFMGMSMSGGPVVSSLVNVFGIRKVAFAGSVICFLSFVVSPLATSVDMLTFTYGFCGGFGVCMVYIPAIIVIGFYFDKRRAFANGLSASGSGAGAFIYSMLCRYLQDKYTWKGAVFILAAVTLNTAACALIFRPLKIRKQVPFSDSTNSSLHQSLLGKSNTSIHTGISVSGSCDLKINDEDGVIGQGNINGTRLNKQHLCLSGITGSSLVHTTLNNNLFNSFKHGEYTKSPLRDNPNLADIYSSVPKLSHDPDSHIPINCYHSVDQLAFHPKPKDDSDRYFKPLERRDIFYSGSMKRLPNFDPYVDVSDESEESKEIGENGSSCCSSPVLKKFRKSSYKVLGLSILNNPVFSVIVFYHLLWTTHSTILTITPKYAMDSGISKSDAALLISVIGFTNTAGRIAAGWIADRPQICSVYVVAAAMFTGGVTCLCIPFTTMFTMLLLEASVFGFCMATWTSLRPIVLVELLGIDNLTNSLGLLALFQGIAFCIGPPLAGLIYDHTQSYMIPYLLAGFAFLLGGVVCIPLPKLATFWNKRQEDLGQL